MAEIMKFKCSQVTRLHASTNRWSL